VHTEVMVTTTCSCDSQLNTASTVGAAWDLQGSERWCHHAQSLKICSGEVRKAVEGRKFRLGQKGATINTCSLLTWHT